MRTSIHRARSERHTRRVLAMILATATIAVACGSGGSEGSDIGDAGPVPDIEVAAESAGSTLPEVVVRDVGAEEWVQLANYLPADKPLLVWFWAPH